MSRVSCLNPRARQNFPAPLKIEQTLSHRYATPEGTFLFQYLPEKKLKQKELEKKSKQ